MTHSPAELAVVAEPEASDPPHWLRGVVLFLGGQTVSLFGSMLVQYAVIWYLTIEYRSGMIIALAAAFGFLPQAVMSVFGGVWADRHSRKLLVIGSDAAIAVTTLVLALVMLGGYDGVWLIFLTMAIRSAGAGVQLPAVSALLPQLAPARQLIRVNGINQSIQAGMALLAPAAAGVLYAWTASGGASATALVPIFFVDVVTAAVGIGIVAFVRVAPVVRTAAPAGYLADLAEGVRYVAHHAFVRWLLVLFAIILLLTVAPTQLAPLLAVRAFDGGTQQNVVTLAVLDVAFSIGMVLGGVAVASVFAKRSRIAMIAGSALVFAALAVGLGLAPNVWVLFAFMFAFGLSVPFFSTPAITLLQETVEPERQGRVFGFVGIVNALAMPVGMMVFGPLADRVPIPWLLVGAGATTLVAIGAALLLPAGRRAVAAARDAASPGAVDAAMRADVAS